jgi:PAS domain S-box-containing protein
VCSESQLESESLDELTAAEDGKGIDWYREQLAAARHRERLTQLFCESVVDYAFVTLDLQNRIIDWNSGAERLLGYSKEEVMGQSGGIFFTPEDNERGEVEKELQVARVNGRAKDERWHMRKGGERFWGSGFMFPLKEDGVEIGFAKVFRDLTATKQTRDQIDAALREKQLLLREMHHRIRNNLQIVTSLMDLQVRNARQAEVRATFESLRDRVRAMASLHETLYDAPDYGSVLLGPYLEQLLRDLRAANATDGRSIDIRLEADDIAVEIDQALPIGLILNELITNSAKHAFPHDSAGVIEVGLKYGRAANEGEGAASTCLLSVSDNGVGLPAKELQELKNTGLHIVEVLIAELHGRLEITSKINEGTRFKIEFPFERTAAEAAHT